jgi:hypothetical protein
MNKQKSYKLKEWERWEDEALYHFPHYCPNCGEHLNKPITYWADSSRPSTPENPFRSIGYDCYCENCHWSGNIEPDADREIIEKRIEPTKFVKFPFKKGK